MWKESVLDQLDGLSTEISISVRALTYVDCLDEAG
jgi:hypothetical protein